MNDLIVRKTLLNHLSNWQMEQFAEAGHEKEYNLLDMIIRGIENEPSVNQWIPVEERLPEKRDWYLAVFKEPDTGFIGLPYIADYLMGNHTAYTTKDGWIIKDCTDRNECESLYHKNLECVAWMPLPEPYKGE